VDDNGGIYFVPAFAGLFAPYWKNDARGVIVGLTRYATRATSPRGGWRPRRIRLASPRRHGADSGVSLKALKVDGGMVYNDMLMQFQADILGVPVIRPRVAETTALGRRVRSGPGDGILEQPGGLAPELGRRPHVGTPYGFQKARCAVPRLEAGRDTLVRWVTSKRHRV